MERTQTDTGTQCTSKEFQEDISICVVWLASEAPEHQENNNQVEVTWRVLQTITHSIIVHTRVYDEYIHFAFIYTTDHIFL